MSITTIKTKIRQLIDDNSDPETDIFTYENSKTFTLTEPNALTITDVLVNGVSSNVIYTSTSTIPKKVTITSSLTFGDTVQIDFTCYKNYSEAELLNYIQSALVHLSVNNYNDFEYDATDDTIYPDLEVAEENLVAIIVATLINPDNKSLRLPNISISVPNDYPVNIKISKLIGSFKRDKEGIFSLLYYNKYL
jgi:hypothetical protein